MQSCCSSLKELTVCSVCLETFTRPKMLPCGHTYCYNCLVSLANHNLKITCPQCRHKHDIPPRGIVAYAENLVLNNLLPFISQEQSKCEDCKERPILTKCKHCGTDICSECLIQHGELMYTISGQLNTIRENWHSEKCKKVIKKKADHISASMGNLNGDLRNAQKKFQERIELMKKHQSQLENTVSVIMRVHTDMLDLVQDKPSNSYINQLAGELSECKTVSQFKEFVNKISDLKMVTHLLQSEKKYFKIEFDDDSVSKMNTICHVKHGSSKVEVQGSYRLLAEMEEDIVAKPAAVGGSGDSATNEVSSNAAVIPYQNRLPKNVNYDGMGNMSIQIVGQGKHTKSQAERLVAPLGSAYHYSRDEIYVCDTERSLVMVYDSVGKNGRVFFDQFPSACNVLISNDGASVFLMSRTRIFKVEVASGATLSHKSSFTLGNFTQCRAMDIHEEYIAVLEHSYKAVILLNHALMYLRHFEIESVRDPRGMCISTDSRVYITDSKPSCVHVFSLDGEELYSFGKTETKQDINGIAVDGDGYVCVARFESDRIDVYDPHCHFVKSLGSSSKSGACQPGCFDGPSRLAFTPDGRLMVGDRNNSRLQIF